MLKEIRNTLVRMFFGSNIIIKSAVKKEILKRNYLRAAAIGLYSLPLRKVLDPQKIFMTAPRAYYEEIHKLLHIAKTKDFELVRIGSNNDGGYIMLDDFCENGIAYSFGIGGNVSWDKEMASRGYDVFMYDHTIEKLPEENSHFHFFKKGIADSVKPDENLKPLEFFIAQNHHEQKQNMILKMDVECAEWGFLENVKTETLSQFSQILFEFHGINDTQFQSKIPSMLRKLNKTHQLVHIHAQNIWQCFSIGTKIFCDQIEVAYVKRDKYKFIEDYDVKLPLEFDMPANYRVPEIDLGYWNRKISPDDFITSVTLLYWG